MEDLIKNGMGNGNMNLDDIMNRLKMIEDELQNKVDNDIFENEIAALRNMIGNIDQEDRTNIQIQTPVAVQPTLPFSIKEIASLKTMIEKFP